MALRVGAQCLWRKSDAALIGAKTLVAACQMLKGRFGFPFRAEGRGSIDWGNHMEPDDMKQQVATRLRQKHGELLTMAETADALKRTADSLKVIFSSSTRRNQYWVQRLIKGRIRIGRRVLFHADAVAAVIVFGDEERGES
jgi:hypothetical protein